MKINKIDELINKEDVKIVLYKEDNDDFVSLLITNKDYTSSRKIEHNNLSFLRELESMDINFYGDEYICEQDIDRCELKKELENRNFLVVMCEDVSESYSIVIDSVSNFRYEFITMIEKVRYNIDGYDNLSSSQIAEIFEKKINSH